MQCAAQHLKQVRTP